MWAAWFFVILFVCFAAMHNPWRPWVAYRQPLSPTALSITCAGFLSAATLTFLIGASPERFAAFLQRLVGE